MSNLEKYNGVFTETFAVTVEKLSNDFSSDTVANWDSVLQLSLVTSIEDAFDVMFEPEDIMDFKSYVIGKEILLKYGIEI
ncbi:hypothetical protein [Kaistella sp.]|uniref:hypothetical protein n=1 Tax=Kaistella sp. TaxID=2782235 RepID=UPI003C6000FF